MGQLDQAQHRPERTDLRVRQNAVPTPFACRLLQLAAGIELDHLAGDAEVEDLADEGANAVRRDGRRPFGDPLNECPHVAAANLARPQTAPLREELVRNQQVSGSSPLAGSNRLNNLRRSRIQTDPTRVTTVSPTTRRPVDIDTPPARRAGEGSTRSPRGSIPRTGQSLTERRPGPMGRPGRPDGTAFRHGGAVSLADGTLDRRRWDRPTAGRDRGVLAQGCLGPGAPDCAATSQITMHSISSTRTVSAIRS